MTLGSETVTLLLRALDTLNLQMSPAQHALLSADERNAALHQLTVTVEAAAKIAEAVQLDAQRAERTTRGHIGPGNMEWIVLESRRRNAAVEAEEGKAGREEVGKEGDEEAEGSAVVGEGAGTMVEQETKVEPKLESGSEGLGECDVENMAQRTESLRDEWAAAGTMPGQDTESRSESDSVSVSRSVPESEGFVGDLEWMMKQAGIMKEVVGGMLVERLEPEANAQGSDPEMEGLMRDVRKLIDEIGGALREKQRAKGDCSRRWTDCGATLTLRSLCWGVLVSSYEDIW
ncbi:hypothetical protein DFP73DRAFT_635953 [Morchella snyderi]|nr:hypothetical protein DFP73DRAFT_635953 [Morchella snyderi]